MPLPSPFTSKKGISGKGGFLKGMKKEISIYKLSSNE
jgi:hypothetical protein